MYDIPMARYLMPPAATKVELLTPDKVEALFGNGEWNGRHMFVIGDRHTTAVATPGMLDELDRFVGGQATQLRAARVGTHDMENPAPAVTFDPEAARVWLAEPARGEAHGLAGDYTPEQSIASLVRSLLFELRLDAYPQVWRNAPDVSDITAYPTALEEHDLADFGAILTVDVGAVQLASHHLGDGDFTGLYWDGVKPPAMPWVDAAVRALRVAAFTVNDMVARWRFATGQYTPKGAEELAYDGFSNNPPKRALTGRERDVLVRLVRDVLTAEASETPMRIPVYGDERALLQGIRHVLDPRTA